MVFGRVRMRIDFAIVTVSYGYTFDGSHMHGMFVTAQESSVFRCNQDFENESFFVIPEVCRVDDGPWL